MHQGLAHMPQMAVLQSATGKGITLQLSPALPCAPAICFPLILSGPGGHGLADMSQMAVPQLAAGKGAPAGGAVGLSGLKELEFISSALESSVHHTVVLSGLKELEFLSSAFESSPWCTTQVGSTDVTAWRGGGWGVREAVGLSGLKELEFLSSALESSPWCTTQVGSTDVTAWRGGGWGVREAVGLSGLKELEFLSSALESSPWCTTQWGCGCVAGEIVGSGASVGGAVGQWGSGAISLSGLKKLEFISSALESSVHHSGNLPLDPAYTYQPTRQASYQASTAGLERQTSASATAPAAAGIASRHSFGAGGAAAAAAAAAAIATVSGRSRGDSVSGLGVGVGGGGGAGMHGLGPERGMHGAAAAHGLHTAAPAAAQGLHASGATAEAAVVQSVREAGDVVLRRGVVIEEVGDGREGCGRPRPANEVSPPRAREGVPGGYPPRKLRHARFGD
ncbi:unnamed protein product [Closterium sp. NIES-64]|nr:unnamed protein product [Closterium sp. NIES-64]